MKEVIAVVRMNKMNRTKEALTREGINAFFAHEVQGRGKGLVDESLLQGAEQGIPEAISLLGEHGKLYPKRMVTVVVPDSQVRKVVRVLMEVNSTGSRGDGKIFVLPLSDAARIRTGETGEAAIA